MMRLALWQAPSPAEDVAGGLAGLGRALAGAAAAGAEVLVGPESFLPGYNSGNIARLAQPRGGDWHQALADLARQAGCALVLGYGERDGDRVFNSAVAFGPDGAELAHYRKIQLYGPREKAIYAPGDRYATFALKGRVMGLLICYDVEFGPHVAALAARGADAVLVPTANMMPYTHVAEATVPAMAANNAVGIVYANYCGVEGDLTYAGGSVITGPHGEILAKAGPGAALLIADLPPRDAARMYNMATDYRPAT
ncbi:nitrilase-related carbon-nitrogen hydrolase [Fuscibacter oryzae]|nr:nitrilase-related carbon-nitrogen hydrolase [Fuscibacter oryzae]